MGVSTSVRWLIAQRSLELVLHAGSTGLERSIDSAVSSELVTAAEWMVGGEVLLTTGLRLPTDAAEHDRYVRSLDAAGVAALGFGVGLGFDEIPEEMITAADEVGLPLFEVPLHIPFSAITRAILDQIAAALSARLVSATRAQPRMTRAAVARGPAAVVRELADAVDRQVVLLDANHVEVASSPRPLAPPELHRLRALVARDPASAGAVVVVDDIVFLMARIGSTTRTFGFLGVVGAALDEVARMLVGHATSLLAIEYAKPQEVRREMVGVQCDVLGSALDGVIGPTALRVLGRAAGPDSRVRVVVFAFADDAAAQRGAARLIDELESRWRAVFVHRGGPEVIALLRGDDSVDVAVGLLSLLGTTGAVRGGIGPSVSLTDDDGSPTTHGIVESAGQARLACRSATGGQLVDLAAASSVLSMDPVRRVLAATHGRCLAPIIDHDRMHGTTLRASLLAYLEANGNWGNAAAALGVHRHTLRSRVERVEDMLDVDLANARTRAELLLMMLGADG